MTSLELAIFIWCAIGVSIGQLSHMVRYILWPRFSRITHCPWCWQDAGIMRDFPAPWSSTICAYHHHLVCAQAKAHRLTRQMSTASTASTTKPAAVIRQTQAEEVQG